MEPEVDIETATADDLEHVVSLWASLVSDQQAYGAHIEPSGNESAARDILGRYIASRNVLIARKPATDRSPGVGVDEHRYHQDRGEEAVFTDPPETVPVGFVMFHRERGLFEQDATRGIVENIYVTPENRGRGIGSALMDRAETELKRDGVDVVALSVMAENDAGRRFYRDRGYEPQRVTFERSVEDDRD
ncbi:MAG: GNAT family N-acetyltransferase [Halodesulfurarchaeum sp.]